jgi:predicted nucleic acid-binding protein
MAVVAVYDACVLYPSPLRDLLIRLAIEELVVARWSDMILDEVFRNLRRDRPDLDPARLDLTRRRMNVAVLDALVPHNPATLGRVGSLPDADDAHVVATALDAGASVIVTFNLRDFPVAVLEPLGLAAVHPDAFVTELWASDADTVFDVLRQQATDLRNPPRTVADVVDALERCGLRQFATLVRVV